MSLLNNTNIYVRMVQRPGVYTDLAQIQLNPAELAYTTDTDRLYIGNSANRPSAVGLRYHGEYSFGVNGKPTYDYSKTIENNDLIGDTTNNLLRRYNKISDTFVPIASLSTTAINGITADLSTNYYTKTNIDALLSSMSTTTASNLASGLSTCVRNNVGIPQSMVGALTIPGITSAGSFTFGLSSTPPRNQNTINNAGNMLQYNGEGMRYVTGGAAPSGSPANGDIWIVA